MLNATQLQKAQAYNKKHVSLVPKDWPRDPASADFARVTARFQAAHGLGVDGMCGSATRAKISTLLHEAKPANYLIVNGRRHAVDFPVVTWEQDPFWSSYNSGNFYWRQAKDISLFVLHWDAAISSRATHKGFQNPERDASVQLYLDADGVVYQAFDLALVAAWHASITNNRSVGVEANNPYYLRYQNPADPRPVVTDAPVNGNTKRPTYLGFYPKQKKRMVMLADAVVSIFGIPRRLPKRPAWESLLTFDDKDAPNSVVRGLLDYRGMATYTGVAAHFNFSDQKIDCGMDVLDEFVAAGY